MPDATDSRPPGWYVEPDGVRTRWWNGSDWTDDYRETNGGPLRNRRAMIWIAIAVILFLGLGIGFLFIGPGILW